MEVIPTKTNEWPQSQIIDGQKVSMASSSGSRVMEKTNQELLQQQQEALKCPRCDSSNTKFCYYNNYSLSQPRHFCKACKRYWTRGGTLRNVPVGGGCRKNKRVKRPITSSAIDTTAPSSSSSSSAPDGASSNPPSQPQMDVASTSSHINPLIYGLPNNSCDMNLRFPRFNPSGYDLQPQMNILGLDFTSGIMYSEASENNYPNGFSLNNTLLSSYTSIFGNSSTSTAPGTTIMSSLLSSTLQQQKFINGAAKDGPGGGANTFQGFASLEELPIAGNNSSSEAEMVALKEVKSAVGQNRLGCNNNGAWQNYQMELVGLSDPSVYWNAATAMGTAWNDQTNIGPSVTFLI